MSAHDSPIAGHISGLQGLRSLNPRVIVIQGILRDLDPRDRDPRDLDPRVIVH
jgi:hypothetical protein